MQTLVKGFIVGDSRPMFDVMGEKHTRPKLIEYEVNGPFVNITIGGETISLDGETAALLRDQLTQFTEGVA